MSDQCHAGVPELRELDVRAVSPVLKRALLRRLAEMDSSSTVVAGFDNMV